MCYASGVLSQTPRFPFCGAVWGSFGSLLPDNSYGRQANRATISDNMLQIRFSLEGLLKRPFIGPAKPHFAQIT